MMLSLYQECILRYDFLLIIKKFKKAANCLYIDDNNKNVYKKRLIY